MKTSELIGLALDWAVDKAEGMPNYKWTWAAPWSTDWSEGGPIIEREGITLQLWHSRNTWTASIKMLPEFTGPTPLIAAMRCYVASKLGEEVDIPEELI